MVKESNFPDSYYPICDEIMRPNEEYPGFTENERRRSLIDGFISDVGDMMDDYDNFSEELMADKDDSELKIQAKKDIKTMKRMDSDINKLTKEVKTLKERVDKLSKPEYASW